MAQIVFNFPFGHGGTQGPRGHYFFFIKFYKTTFTCALLWPIIIDDVSVTVLRI